MLLILLSSMLMSLIVRKSEAPSNCTTMRKDFGTNLSATDSLAVKAIAAPISLTCNPRALLRFASENTVVLYKIDAQPTASSMKLKSGKLLPVIQTSKISTLTADLAATPAVVLLLPTAKEEDCSDNSTLPMPPLVVFLIILLQGMR